MKIEIENLEHVYSNGVKALVGIDLTIDGIEPLAIIGQNGAGKTTLVKHLNGILQPTGGRVLLGGVDVRSKPIWEWATTVGYVFQNPDDQLFASSVEDELTFGPRQIGMSRERIAQQIARVSELVGLSKKLNTHPYDLSPAERKFCTIGSVLMMNPKVVVFDEPTCGQDALGNWRLKEIIHSLNSEGTLCITISHDMKFVAENFERVIVMKQGSILTCGTAVDVFAQPDLLHQSFVFPPPVTRVAQAAGMRTTPLTVLELIDDVKKERK
ncbi:energy-coupling factor ABC transporter ATP-binding protein [Corynebacterium glucuronolyticum]|uniref:energy-coupling factor ABC transporter ATP-binding protein n=1 Tax=Corynebacterium glucuronolyticum TaxID=39791 RepID=UPI00019C1AD0|nr:ABC transporter ATP-binding protein [Corynebacterium glucuronolyticum]EEI27851.1 ABC transporter, ATP-binding protein [Corynebacterium glucuronolyticum ATCC 51867]QRO82102.1 ABC transporter ATP-binding protein [Corynebacterium glucuronolyticum]